MSRDHEPCSADGEIPYVVVGRLVGTKQETEREKRKLAE